MLIPSHLLVSFSAKELEQIISGEHGINVSALQRRTKYMAGYHNGSKAIQWLWDVLGTFSEVSHVIQCSVHAQCNAMQCFPAKCTSPMYLSV